MAEKLGPMDWQNRLHGFELSNHAVGNESPGSRCERAAPRLLFRQP